MAFGGKVARFVPLVFCGVLLKDLSSKLLILDEIFDDPLLADLFTLLGVLVCINSNGNGKSGEWHEPFGDVAFILGDFRTNSGDLVKRITGDGDFSKLGDLG